MADEVVKTKDELLAEMKVATDAGDWKAVSRVSSQIAKAVAGEEKAEKDAKQLALAGITEDIKKTLDKAIGKFIDVLDPATLEAMDGVWYSQDFGEKLTTCRIVKGAVRKSGGGGGGKKFSITTNELLGKHGGVAVPEGIRPKFTDYIGRTWKETYDADTGGNFRYQVREELLKLEGLL